jgi:hypothetical protein
MGFIIDIENKYISPSFADEDDPTRVDGYIEYVFKKYSVNSSNTSLGSDYEVLIVQTPESPLNFLNFARKSGNDIWKNDEGKLKWNGADSFEFDNGQNIRSFTYTYDSTTDNIYTRDDIFSLFQGQQESWQRHIGETFTNRQVGYSEKSHFYGCTFNLHDLGGKIFNDADPNSLNSIKNLIFEDCILNCSGLPYQESDFYYAGSTTDPERDQKRALASSLLFGLPDFYTNIKLDSCEFYFKMINVTGSEGTEILSQTYTENGKYIDTVDMTLQSASKSKISFEYENTTGNLEMIIPIRYSLFSGTQNFGSTLVTKHKEYFTDTFKNFQSVSFTGTEQGNVNVTFTRHDITYNQNGGLWEIKQNINIGYNPFFETSPTNNGWEIKTYNAKDEIEAVAVIDSRFKFTSEGQSIIEFTETNIVSGADKLTNYTDITGQMNGSGMSNLTSYENNDPNGAVDFSSDYNTYTSSYIESKVGAFPFPTSKKEFIEKMSEKTLIGSIFKYHILSEVQYKWLIAQKAKGNFGATYNSFISKDIGGTYVPINETAINSSLYSGTTLPHQENGTLFDVSVSNTSSGDKYLVIYKSIKLLPTTFADKWYLFKGDNGYQFRYELKFHFGTDATRSIDSNKFSGVIPFKFEKSKTIDSLSKGLLVSGVITTLSIAAFIAYVQKKKGKTLPTLSQKK